MVRPETAAAFARVFAAAGLDARALRPCYGLAEATLAVTFDCAGEGVRTAPENFLGDYPMVKWQRFADAVPHDLSGKTVLDIGCNAGFYAMEMKRRGADRVLGIDFDPDYLAQARFAAEVEGLDIEFRQMSVYDVGALAERFDVVFFIGVLYHLLDPVRHLRDVLARTRRAIMLDTHYAQEGAAVEAYEVDGRVFAYRHFVESGRADAFAGMYDHAKWLPLDTLTALLAEGGFAHVDVAELREERNGPRALIYATRN